MYNPEDVYVTLPRLRDVLDSEAPTINRDSLTSKQLTNLEWYESQVKEMIDEVDDWALMVFDLNRSSSGVRKPQFRMDDCTTCLTTKNGALWIQGVSNTLHNYGRWLLPEERLKLQGLPSALMALLPNKTSVVTAAGNAMSLPCIGLVLAFGMQDRGPSFYWSP